MPDTVPSQSESKMDIIMKYAKANKRTTKDLDKFTNVKNWPEWRCHLTTISRAQGIAHVYTEYEPKMEKEKIIYQADLNFAYACLSHVIQTQEGKQLMQVYHPTSDAWAVIQKLSTKLMKGEKGKSRAQELEEKIKNKCLDSSWKQTKESWLLE
jgi:hypothetical protein